MEIGISEALRSILPRGTTGRLNSKTICLPGGTSTPEGVMRVILRFPGRFQPQQQIGHEKAQNYEKPDNNHAC